jgi:hypothetical protein
MWKSPAEHFANATHGARRRKRPREIERSLFTFVGLLIVRILLMSRFGGFSEVGVLIETEIQKLRRIALAHGGGSVWPLDLFKLEVD